MGGMGEKRKIDGKEIGKEEKVEEGRKNRRTEGKGEYMYNNI